MPDREPFPERTARGHVRAFLEAGVASVPWVGGAGAQLLDVYLPSALEKRRDEWFRLLDERLADVEARVLADESFQTIVLEATKAALGTHLDEKLRLLAASVLSSAEMVDRGADHYTVKRLLRWVEELEPVHFRILGAIRDDDGWGGQVSWQDVLARVPIDDDVWYHALEDLTSRRVVGTTGYNPDVRVEEYLGELIWVMPPGAELVEFTRLMVDAGPGDSNPPG